MKLTDLKHDVNSVQDNVLGDLDTQERVRQFMKAVAEDREDRIEMLRDSVPRYEYEMPDLEFTEGTKEVYVLSMLANHTLERLYTATLMHEAGRDKHVALVLVNEALERLSQGHFTVDEYGNADAPESWPLGYDWMDNADTSRLGGMYRELWDENDLPLPSSFENRVSPYFAELATDSLLGYRHDLEVLEDGVSRIALIDEKLSSTVVEFYVAFHTFRRLAEEHLGTTLDELLQATQAERGPFDTSPGPLDEAACHDLLKRKEFYLTSHEEAMEVLADAAKDMDTDVAEELALSKPDLDAEVDEAVEEMAAQFDYAI